MNKEPSPEFEKSEEILKKLFDSVKNTYHLFIEFFLLLNKILPEEQDELAEKYIKDLGLASMSSQDITKSLMSSFGLSVALVGLKKGKEISKSCDDILNIGCPCEACQASGQPISLKTFKSPAQSDLNSNSLNLKTSASKLDKKLN